MKLYQRIQQGWFLLASMEQIIIAVVLLVLLGNLLSAIIQPDIFPFAGSLLLFVLAGSISCVLCIMAHPIELD